MMYLKTNLLNLSLYLLQYNLDPTWCPPSLLVQMRKHLPQIAEDLLCRYCIYNLFWAKKAYVQCTVSDGRFDIESGLQI